MTLSDEKLSAYLDGELTEAEAREIEALVEADPAVQNALERLMEADQAAKDVFDEMLAEPVPLNLASAIRNAPKQTTTAPEPVAAPRGLPGWLAIAASVGFLAVGGLGGYSLGTGSQPQVVATAGWLTEIAAYHGVYETQQRHLVEVAADETPHIETWLGNTTGVPFSVPDLAGNGLDFQGARLLVAGGLPVAQLIYTDADGAVFALCLKQAKAPEDKAFTAETVDGFSMVSWRSGGADYVVVGPDGADLSEMAEVASTSV